jgi:hypothetical protein
VVQSVLAAGEENPMVSDVSICGIELDDGSVTDATMMTAKVDNGFSFARCSVTKDETVDDKIRCIESQF